MTKQEQAEFPTSDSLGGSNVVEAKEVVDVDSGSGTNEEGAEAKLEQQDPNEPPPSPRNIHGIKWILSVVAVVSSILLYATDNTIVRPQTTFFRPCAPYVLTKKKSRSRLSNLPLLKTSGNSTFCRGYRLVT